MTGPRTIDDYLRDLPADQRKALTQLRRTILTLVPDAEEAIRTRVPAIRRNGKTFVGFGAARHHLALYVMYGTALRQLRAELDAFDHSRTLVRFTPNRPLPPALMERIVAIRLAEIDAEPRESSAATGSQR